MSLNKDNEQQLRDELAAFCNVVAKNGKKLYIAGLCRNLITSGRSMLAAQIAVEFDKCHKKPTKGVAYQMPIAVQVLVNIPDIEVASSFFVDLIKLLGYDELLAEYLVELYAYCPYRESLMALILKYNPSGQDAIWQWAYTICNILPDNIEVALDIIQLQTDEKIPILAEVLDSLVEFNREDDAIRLVDELRGIVDTDELLSDVFIHIVGTEHSTRARLLAKSLFTPHTNTAAVYHLVGLVEAQRYGDQADFLDTLRVPLKKKP